MTPNGEYYHCKHVTGMTAGSCLKCLAERQSNQSDNARANPPKPRAKLGQSRADNAMACDHKMTEPGMDGNTYCINCTGRVLRLGNAMAGELDSFKYFIRYLQAMPDVDKYALAPEQIDAIAVKVSILLENERARLLEDLEIEHTKELEACITSTRQDLLESLQREMPEPKDINIIGRIGGYGEEPLYVNGVSPDKARFNAGYNYAIDQVNQLLTKYVQGGENGE